VTTATPAASKGRELQARLWVGAVLIALASGALFLDRHLAPYYPCLLALVVVLGGLAAAELHALLAGQPRPPLWLTVGAAMAVLLANWAAHLAPARAGPWEWVAGALVAVVLAGFLWEMTTFREPGGVVARVAVLTLVAAYLGLLPSFLAQLRWWPESGATAPDLRAEAALALVFFVPKFCDVGAYFTGRYLGRHRMTPVLSPKKTWEGLAGGLLAAALTALLINRLVHPVIGGDGDAALFGVAVGGAGVLGDLAESLVKRDGGHKDASATLPGFGGILDVVDSVLFAAPVAWWWLRA
jgi:phosphatidate cytidylyltransferase